MNNAKLLLVGYGGPVELSLPVPSEGLLRVGQVIRLPGDILASIEIVTKVGGRLIATAHLVEPEQARDSTDLGSGEDLPIPLRPDSDWSEGH